MATDPKTSQAIFHGSTRVGLRNVGSYQVSGHPFITGSTNLDDNKVHMVQFPYVSKSFTVINNNSNSGEDIRVHFQSGSTATITVPGDTGEATVADGQTQDVIGNHHYITIPAGYASVTFETKVKNFFISNASGVANLKYQVFAELTNVQTQSMYHLTGSGVTE
tara:strand:+ start:232 stop:723 length:492 start_codon:yes stop_codon:yes gene_type:complete